MTSWVILAWSFSSHSGTQEQLLFSYSSAQFYSIDHGLRDYLAAYLFFNCLDECFAFAAESAVKACAKACAGLAVPNKFGINSKSEPSWYLNWSWQPQKIHFPECLLVNPLPRNVSSIALRDSQGHRGFDSTNANWIHVSRLIKPQPPVSVRKAITEKDGVYL